MRNSYSSRYNSGGSRGNSNFRHSNSRRRYGGGRSNTKQRIDPTRFVKKATMVSEEDKYISENSFDDFRISDILITNLQNAGFDSPLPIQDKSIPHAMNGRDVIGLANTGSGKTAAFLLPLIHKQIDIKHLTLILVPTRELAIQIDDDFRKFAQGLNIYSALCVGGQPLWKQKSSLQRNPHFVIGTPGRIKDLIERKLIKLDYCKSLVLDEVDRMVDMGFIKDITHILSLLPRERQSLFFTATISPSIENIIRSFLNDPIKISVKTGETADGVEQDIVRVQVGENKFDKLHQIITQNSTNKTLVFGETKRGVEKIHSSLLERGVKSVSIHGAKNQSQRQRALLQFRSGEASVMVATDVAARGLDIKDINQVINFDTPQTYDDYIHRIGRTGRAGKKGYAFTFV
jgi:ATP-dependent RNA helicase RhlE